MADERRPLNFFAAARRAACAIAIAALALVGCGNDSSQSTGSTPAPTSGAATTSASPAATPSEPAPTGFAAPVGTNLVRVTIKGEAFDLEPAINQTTRVRGLGGRASLPERGGMIFAFPFSERLEFVMRDCLMDIDIAYLNNDGRVLSMHTMPNEPREPGESDMAYEQRLTRYPSRFPARFAVEVRAGLLRELGLEVGDVIEFDRAALKARAR